MELLKIFALASLFYGLFFTIYLVGKESLRYAYRVKTGGQPLGIRAYCGHIKTTFLTVKALKQMVPSVLLAGLITFGISLYLGFFAALFWSYITSQKNPLYTLGLIMALTVFVWEYVMPTVNQRLRLDRNKRMRFVPDKVLELLKAE